MGDKSTSFLDLSAYSKPNLPNTTQNKQAAVSDAARMKAFLLSSPEDLHVAATASGNGNAVDPLVHDLQTLSATELDAKYGPEGMAKAANFYDAVIGVRDLKERDRTYSQVAQDTVIDTALAAANVVGGVGVLAAQAGDAVLNAPAKLANAIFGEDTVQEVGRAAPVIAEGLGWLNETAKTYQSDLRQRREAQHQIEGALNQQDSEAAYQAATQGMPEGFALSKTPAWFSKQGQDFADAVTNYVDDPIMAGSLVPEMVGSMIPSTGAIKMLGKAQAVKQLTKQGIAGEAADLALKTQAGRAIANEAAVRVAPAVIGVTEAGSAVAQTQQEMLGYSQDEMLSNPAYVEYRNAGLSHEQALNQLAGSAGNVTAAVALPAAILAGKIGAKFEADPLHVGSSGGVGSALMNGAKTVVKEGVEETLQEGSNAIAGNAGLASVGQDVSLDRGVAAAAAEGFVGGLAGAGALQGPGIALQTTKEIGAPALKAAGSAIKAGVDARMKSIDDAAEKASGIDAGSMSKAAEAASAAADNIKASVDSAAANQDEGSSPAADPVATAAANVSERASKAVYLDPEESKAYAEMYPSLAPVAAEGSDSPAPKIKRADFIQEAGKALTAKDTSSVDKFTAAISILSSMDSMREFGSDQSANDIAALPEDSPVRADQAALSDFLGKMESSPILKAANDEMAKLTSADVDALLPVEDMKAGKLDAETKANMAQFLSIVGRVNSAAVDPSYYAMVRNQITPDQSNAQLLTSLEVSQTLSEEAVRADAAKAELDQVQKAVLPEQAQAYKSKDIVRNEIYSAEEQKADPNKRGMASLAVHRRRVGDAIIAGRSKDALRALKELRNFAESMANKVVAINQSSENNDRKPVPYQAFGPYGTYTDKKGAYAYTGSVKGTAYAVDVNIDANAVASTYNAMMQGYGALLGMTKEEMTKIAVEPLHERMASAHADFVKRAGIETSKIEATQAEEAQTKAPQTEAPASKPEQAEPAPTEASQDASNEADQSRTDAPEPVAEQSEPQHAEPEQSKAEKPAAKVSAAKAWFDWLSTTALTPYKRINHFLKSFKAKDEGSSFMENESAAQFILDNLEELSDVSNGMKYSLSDAEKGALTQLAGSLVPKMVSEIQTAFSLALRQKRGGQKAGSRVSTWLGDIETGEKDVLAYHNAMVANFGLLNEDGEYVLEDRVVEAAAMAAIEWAILNTARGKPFLDAEQINKVLGLPRRNRVTKEMREIATSGAMNQPVLDEISRKIMELIGVTPDRNASSTFTQGLFKSLAGTVLEAMQKQGVIEIKNHKLSVNGKDKFYATISEIEGAAESFDDNLLALRDLKNMPDIFTRVFLPNSEKTRYIGKAPQKVASKLLRNSFSSISPDQEAVLKDRQNAHYNMNMLFVGAWKAMGDKFVADMLGFTEMKDKKFNKVMAKIIESKNRAILNDLAGVDGYLAEAQQFAGSTDAEAVGAVKIFFDWAFSSVGRLQQVGPVTPQGNKFTREMITITNATVNLLDPEGDAGQLGDVWMAIAQSAGVSIEKMSRDQAIAQARDAMLAGDKLLPAVDAMLEYLRTGEMTEEGRAAYQKAVRAFSKKPTAKLMHAIFVAAQMEHALDQGEDAAMNFKTSLAIEADGKTDGPINAIIHMTTGAFTDGFTKLLAKGGWFFTNEQQTLNKHILKDKEDLYHLAATAFEKKLTEKLSLMQKTDDRELNYMVPLLRVMDAFLPDFGAKAGSRDVKDEMSFEISRNLVKNPLTVFIYGSSAGGIANKILGAMEESIYQTLTEIAQSGKGWESHPTFAQNPDLVKDLRMLFNVGFEKDGTPIKMMMMEPIRDLLARPEEAQISSRLADQLTNGIEKYFAEPMIEAIDEVTLGLATNMKLTQKASQIHAMIFSDVFNALLAKRQAEYKAETKSSLILPEAEISKVFREAMQVAPVYVTDDQEFHISGKEGTDSGLEVGTALSGAMKATAKMPMANEASVKVSPYMTIGLGDGQMILNIYKDGSGALKATLPVFDGVEIGVDQARAASEQINKSVYEGWMGTNTYQSIADGLRQTLLTADLKSLTPATKSEIARSLGMDKSMAFDTNVMSFLAGLVQNLQGKANEAAARKAALSKVNSWVDHMAGMGAPHNNKGEMIEPELVEERLNEIYAEELAKIEAEQGTEKSRPANQKNDSKVYAAVRSVGTLVDGFKSTHMFHGPAALALVRESLGASKDQVELFREIEKSGALKNVRIFRGSAKELNRLKRKFFPNLDAQPIQEGQTFVGAGIMFLTNASPETVLHEAIHAFVSKAVNDFYQDPESLPKEVRDAAKRMEGLLEEFKLLDPRKLPANIRTPYQTLMSQLTNQSTSAAEKLDEFIAWTLANQNLSNLASKLRVNNPLALIANKVLALLKRMLGISSGPGKNLLENVRFNARILGTYAPSKALNEEQTTVEQALNQIYGDDRNLEGIEQAYVNKMQDYLVNSMPDPTDQAGSAEFQARTAELKNMTDEALNQALYAGYGMNDREQAAFRAVHGVMFSGIKLNSAVNRKAATLFDHALKNLTEASFLAVDGLTPETADSAEYTAAANMLARLTGDTGYRKNAEGKSDMLATFMALAHVSPALRGALAQIEAPKSSELKWDSFDSALRSLGSTILNLITNFTLARKVQPKSVKDQLDALSGSISEIQKTHQILTAIERYNPVETINGFLSEKIEAGADKAVDLLEGIRQSSNSRVIKNSAAMASLIVSLGSKNSSAAQGDGITRILNQTTNWHSVRSILNDMRGMTDDNKSLFRLMNIVKSSIDAIRQDFREQVPDNLAKAFSRKLAKHEWSRLHQGLAQIDLLALGKEKARAIIQNPAQIKGEIQAEEEALAAFGTPHFDLYKQKAKALATYLAKRQIISSNLLRNAYAIATLAGEVVSVAQLPAGLEQSIDRLVSLYAYDMLEKNTKETMKSLSEAEKKGMQTLTGFLGQTREAELARMTVAADGAKYGVSRLNGWKGYVPSTIQEGHSIIIADELEAKYLAAKGFKRIGSYKGDPNEGYRGKRAYFQSTVGSRNAFRQGVAQTVHASWQGVDVRTGLSQGNDTQGHFYGEKAKALHQDLIDSGMLTNSLAPDMHLLPVLNADGEVVAYELPMEQEMLAGLDRDTHLGRMLGVWAGRISEENEAGAYNADLLQVLKEIYDKQKGTRKAEFVNLADKDLKDKVYKDAWNTLGWKIKQDAAKIFGEPDFFPVRRDMIEDAVGYRAAGLTDAWSGISRWSPETQERMRQAAVLVIGKNAYQRLKQFEDGAQALVAYAKTNIVIRGVKVVFDNVISNNFHLLFVGVSPLDILKGTRDKFLEVSTFVKNREEIMRLQIELSGLTDDKARAKSLVARIQAYEDANAALSIQPLIQAGELSTVAENLDEADVAIREGRIAEFIEKATDRLPGVAKTVAKNVMITKDTALYQGLNRAVQYGDFVAKAILFDHMIKQGKTEREALDRISEEFVNYNRLAGRGRDFLESMGALWFYNYKLRISKIAMNTARNRPLSALLIASGAEPTFGADTVFNSNLINKIFEGKTSYSIGPQMGFHSLSLNPFIGGIL